MDSVSRCQWVDSDSEAPVDFVTSGSFVFPTLSGYYTTQTNHTVEHDYGRKLLGVNIFEPSVVDTSCIFPEGRGQSFIAGEKYVLLVVVKNNGNSTLVMVAIICDILRPNDQDQPVSQLGAHASLNQTVKPSAAGTFAYSFNISNQTGKYDLVGTILYYLDDPGRLYSSTCIDGTIEIEEAVSTSPFTFTVHVMTVILLTMLCLSIWMGCIKLNQKWEDKKNAKRAREEAEADQKAQEEAEADQKAREEAAAFQIPGSKVIYHPLFKERTGVTFIDHEQSTSYKKSKKKS